MDIPAFAVRYVNQSPGVNSWWRRQELQEPKLGQAIHVVNPQKSSTASIFYQA